MCPTILHSAACSLASRTLTGLGLLEYSASTHSWKGQAPPQQKYGGGGWGVGRAVVPVVPLVPTPLISLLLNL